MSSKDNFNHCKHSISSRNRKQCDFWDLYKTRRLWSQEGMQYLIRPCTRCGVLTSPPAWVLTIIGALDTMLYFAMYYCIAAAVTFRVFGESIYIYIVTSAIIHVLMYGMIQRAVKSALLMVFPWTPLKKQQHGVKETEALYNSYVRGRQIGTCLNAVILICFLIC